MTFNDGAAGDACSRDLGGHRDPGFAETDQREVAEGRYRAALDQFDSARARQPLRVARPCEFGAPPELADHRLKPLLDEATHPGIRTDPAQQDNFAAGTQNPGEL